MIQFELPNSNNIEEAIASYLSANDEQARKPSMNTILIILSQKKISLKQIVTLLENYMKKQSIAVNSLQLLYQIIKRKKDILLTTQTESCIVKMLSEKVLNLSTILPAIKTIFQLCKRSFPQFLFKQVFELLSNPKFHPTSHRQQIRYIVYQIIEIMTKHMEYIQTSVIQTKFITLVIDSTFEEKDPRNIGKMFTLYHWLINNMKISSIQPFKNSIFDNLQAYYPIDYIGDDDQQTNTALIQLNNSLDSCLTLPLFNQQCLQLLENKTATPPILQFLPTIKKYIKNNPTVSYKLQTILQRFIQQEFLQDALSYPLIVECFSSFFEATIQSNVIISINNYQYLTKILGLALKILSTKSGFVILLIKALSSLKSTKNIVTSFVINHIIINYKLYNTDNLGYLLGLLIVIDSKIEDQQIMLLHLSLIDIFNMQPVHIQVMVLKIFMNFKKKNYKQRSIQPIVKKLLSLLKSTKQDIILRKSVLEFIQDAGDKILKFQAQQYVDQIKNNLPKQKQVYSNIEMMVYHLMLNGPECLSVFLNEQSQLSESIMDEINSNIFKLETKRIVNNIVSYDYQVIHQKYLNKFKQIVSKIASNQQMSQAIENAISQKIKLGSKFKYVFYPWLKYSKIEIGQITNTDHTTNIRQLKVIDLKQLELNLQKSILKSLCNESSDDYPTLRQYLFEKIYPLILKRSEDTEYQYLLFLILQKTPSSLLINSISSIIQLIMNKLQNSTLQIASISMQILNDYFDNVPEQKYDRIVTIGKKILLNYQAYGMNVLCSLAQIFSKMATIGGQIKYRRIILEGLQKLLGNKKRKVRKAAAYSYNKWYYM